MNEKMRKLQDIHALQFWLCQDKGRTIHVENGAEVDIDLYLDDDLDPMVRTIFSLDYIEDLTMSGWLGMVRQVKEKDPALWRKIDKNYAPCRMEAQMGLPEMEPDWVKVKTD